MLDDEDETTSGNSNDATSTNGTSDRDWRAGSHHAKRRPNARSARRKLKGPPVTVVSSTTNQCPDPPFKVLVVIEYGEKFYCGHKIRGVSFEFLQTKPFFC